MASPAFTINGGSPLVKAAVSASSTVTCVLDDLDGVRQVDWSIAGTDETTDAGDYSLGYSGLFNSTMTTTSLTAGTAARVRCTINAGIDPQTGATSEAMTAEAKFYVVPEVLCADEFNESDRISSLTHGAVATVNPGLRTTLGGTPAFTSVTATFFASSTGNAATSGTFRGSSGTTALSARNNANLANIDLVSTDSSDNITVGDASDATAIFESVKTSGFWAVKVNSTEAARIDSVGLKFPGNASATGLVRAANNATVVAARNAANSQDINVIGTDSSNRVVIGENTDCAGVEERVATGGAISAFVNNVEIAKFHVPSAVQLTFTGNTEITGNSNISIKPSDLAVIDAVNAWYLERSGVVQVVGEASGVALHASAGSYGSGTKVLFVANASANPSTNPTGGGILYADAGAGKWRGSGGTVTTFGPAEPHCPVCGSDFTTEHESPIYGYLAVCLKCLADELGERQWIRRSKA